MEERIEIKVVLVGNTNVGKTCMCNYAITGIWDGTASPTLGASFLSKTISFQGKEVHIQIWDTAGQEKYRGMTPMYYRGAQVALIVFSLADHKSFEDVEVWMRSLREYADPNIALVLIGSKCDLEDSREVLTEHAMAKASELGARYFETSAKTGQGINDVFDEIPDTVINQKQLVTQATGQSDTVKLSKNSKGKKKCC